MLVEDELDTGGDIGEDVGSEEKEEEHGGQAAAAAHPPRRVPSVALHGGRAWQCRAAAGSVHTTAGCSCCRLRTPVDTDHSCRTTAVQRQVCPAGRPELRDQAGLQSTVLIADIDRVSTATQTAANAAARRRGGQQL